MLDPHRVTIGIHLHSEPAALRATLEALAQNTPGSAEILLLPDGPDASMQATLAELTAYRQLGTTLPAGAPACFNRLIQASAADYFVFLESGSLVGPEWLDRLLQGIAADPRHGLAGPSTNHAWNEQGVFRGSLDPSPAAIAATASQAAQRFGSTLRTLDPLYSLADFCYLVRREVVEAIGGADEAYGLGPCWEMDYNIRASRAGFQGVWVGGAYVHRLPFTARRRRDEEAHFETNRRRYQDRFCGLRLRGERSTYARHCRGQACSEFAPPSLITLRRPLSIHPPAAVAPTTPAPANQVPAVLPAGRASLTDPLRVSCIMPTCNRRAFIPRAVQYFLRQEYAAAELLVVDDGSDPIADCLPDHPRIRYLRLEGRRTLGEKRNLACETARGELIAHWDDDDWYPPWRLQVQVEALDRQHAALCGSTSAWFWDPTADRAFLYRYTGDSAMLVGTTLLYRRDAWRRNPFPAVQVGEDVRFVASLDRAARVDLALPALCVATIHPSNTSPRNPSGLYWQPASPAAVHALLGSDLACYRASPSQSATEDRVLVSCIMPTHNRRAFVPLALRCFAAQDHPAKELIVVDDGSDPIGDLTVDHPGVRYYRLPQRTSIGAKRNYACAQARGSIIVHWDDDDWYSAARIRYQIAPILASEADITGLQIRFILVLPGGQCWTVRRDLHERMLAGDVAGGTLAFRRALFAGGLRYPEVDLAEDAAFLRAALLRGQRLQRLDNPGMFVYMRHGRNTWRFTPGHFLDPNGWEPIEVPAALLPEDVASFCAAARSSTRP